MKASFEDTIEHKEERDHESTFAPIAAGGDLCCRRDGSKDRRQQQWVRMRSEEHTSELQSHSDLVCRLLLEYSRASCLLHSFPTRRSSDLSGGCCVSSRVATSNEGVF